MMPKITPEEVTVPVGIKDHSLYMEGFQHGLVSNRLDIVPGKPKMYGFKQSFREGFRAAKLWLRDNGYSTPTLPTKLITR